MLETKRGQASMPLLEHPDNGVSQAAALLCSQKQVLISTLRRIPSQVGGFTSQ